MRLMPVEYIAMKKELPWSDYIIVVAHPDDEIIFSSSIVKNAKKVVICFNDVQENKALSEGRKSAQSDFPLKNTKFLNVVQARSVGRQLVYNERLETDFGIIGSRHYEDYKSSYLIIKSKLRYLLKNSSHVITHNPWGEYGHSDHIQVHKIVVDLSKEIGYKCIVFGYTGISNFKYYKSKQHLLENCIKLPTNHTIYNRLKNHYVQNHCWTWWDKYLPGKYEYFFSYKKNILKERVHREYPIMLIYMKLVGGSVIEYKSEHKFLKLIYLWISLYSEWFIKPLKNLATSSISIFKKWLS